MKTEESMTRAEKKFAMIESWKASGLSQAQYCKEHQIALSNFSYWFKKYRSAGGNEPTKGSFVELKVKRPTGLPSSSVVMDLVLSDGRRLNFYQPVDASYLRELLS